MRALVLSGLLAFGIVGVAIADTEENAEDFMAMHEIEIAFHQAGTTKNLNQMLSLFSDDATLEAGGKTYTGKGQIRAYWQAAGAFQPQNQWVVYTPAFRIKYDVRGKLLTCISNALPLIKRRTRLSRTRIPTTP